MDDYVLVVGNSVYPKRQTDKRVFSKSDIEVLDSVIGRLRNMTAGQIRKMAHDEASCKESLQGCPIDFDLFFRDHPEAEPVKILAEREQESRDVLRLYAAG